MSTIPCTIQCDGFSAEISVDAQVIFQLAINRWVQDQGDVNLLMRQNLNSRSNVVDVGGYIGVWAEKIMNKFDTNIHVLEPVPHFFAQLQEKFTGHPKVQLLPYGLGRPGRFPIQLTADGTSLFGAAEHSEVQEVVIRTFSDFIAESGLDSIDLMQINIEGAEYDLLDEILAGGFMPMIRKLQVQFHLNVTGAVERRASIRNRLALTHRELFNYPFIWEAWEALPV